MGEEADRFTDRMIGGPSGDLRKGPRAKSRPKPVKAKAPPSDLTTYLRQSLHLIRGRICSVALAVDFGDVVVDHAGLHLEDPLRAPLGAWDDIERGMLDTIQRTLAEGKVCRQRPGIIVGYNCIDFDLPRLYMRMLRHNHPLVEWVPWPGPGVKPWDLTDRIHDVMLQLAGINKGSSRFVNSCRQIEAAEYLGVDTGEDPGQGDNVYRWAVEGNWDTIGEHNRVDIEVLRQLYSKVYGWSSSERQPRVFLDIETIPNPADPRWGQFPEEET